MADLIIEFLKDYGYLGMGIMAFLAGTVVPIASEGTGAIYTAKNADKIIVLDGGVIVDFDTHENLLANCEVYQEIYNSQLKRGDD